MLLKNDAIHTQSRVDAASFDGNAELDVECIAEGRKIFFVFGKNMAKRCFKREVS